VVQHNNKMVRITNIYSGSSWFQQNELFLACCHLHFVAICSILYFEFYATMEKLLAEKNSRTEPTLDLASLTCPNSPLFAARQSSSRKMTTV